MPLNQIDLLAPSALGVETLKLIGRLGIFVLDREAGVSQRSTVMEALELEPFAPGELERRLHPEDRARVLAAVEGLRKGVADELCLSYRVLLPSGDGRWIESRGAVLRRDELGDISLLVGLDLDLSAERAREEELRSQVAEAEQRYAIVESLRSAGLVAAASLDLDVIIARVLEEAQQCLPFEAAALYVESQAGTRLAGSFPSDRAAPGPAPSSLAQQAMSSKTPMIVSDLAQDPDGSGPEGTMAFRSWIGVPLIYRGEKLGVLELWSGVPGALRGDHIWPAMSFGDLLASEIEAGEKYRGLVEEANTDPLTGLLTRRSFNRAAWAAISRLAARGQSLSLIMVDIDRFKSINDRYGHLVGDETLKAVAGILKTGLRQHDLFSRFGGEEMVALLPGASLAVASGVAERLRYSLESQSETLMVERVTASFGVASCEAKDCASIDALVERADVAMYRAKEAGRNRVELALPERLSSGGG
jgi:diguanylate cyclase (GGDEF) domain